MACAPWIHTSTIPADFCYKKVDTLYSKNPVASLQFILADNKKQPAQRAAFFIAEIQIDFIYFS